MADLKTLQGIGAAREELYNKLAAGEIPETRANIMERVLRGQVALKGELPMRFVKLVAGYKGGKLEGYVASTVGEIAGFIGEGKALTE
jgi:hypothetical protein